MCHCVGNWYTRYPIERENQEANLRGVVEELDKMHNVIEAVLRVAGMDDLDLPRALIGLSNDLSSGASASRHLAELRMQRDISPVLACMLGSLEEHYIRLPPKLSYT